MNGRLSDLEHSYTNRTYYISGTNTSLAIELSHAYEEDVVIYSNCGSAKSAKYLNLILPVMRFKDIVLASFIKRYLELPQDYVSIHIRNTDIKSNIDEFLKANSKNLKDKKIYLATDDRLTIEKLKKVYKENIYNFANIPNNDGKNIHHNHGSIPQTDFIIDCFVDVLLLAAASEYYYSNERSGYSKFANTLYSDKQLLHQITAAVLSPSSILRNRKLTYKKQTVNL
jgi:hypothetical protein